MTDGKTSLNLELLIKLLKLTTSSNDGEALLASRKANEVLAKFGGDWEALLHSKVTVIADPFAGTAPAPEVRHAPPPKAPTPKAPTPRPQPAPAPRSQTFAQPASPFMQPAQKPKMHWHKARPAAQAAAQATPAPTRNTLRKQRITLDDLA